MCQEHTHTYTHYEVTFKGIFPVDSKAQLPNPLLEDPRCGAPTVPFSCVDTLALGKCCMKSDDPVREENMIQSSVPNPQTLDGSLSKFRV